MNTVAVACETAEGLDAKVSGHFGRTPFFVTAQIADGAIVSWRSVPSPGQGGGRGTAAFVHSLGATAIIVGGLGEGASRGLMTHGIAIVAGASGSVGAVLSAYAKGTLITGEAAAGCDHHAKNEDHGHGHGGGHGCGGHHHHEE
jgi:predicted Fe-Mo cluster-binding NifX family protein